MKNVLTSAADLYLIEFRANHNHFIFNGGEPEELGNLIQAHNRYGIEKICRYNRVKMKFDKLSKSDVKRLFNFDTHSIIQLEKTNFIK